MMRCKGKKMEILIYEVYMKSNRLSVIRSFYYDSMQVEN